MLKSCVDKTEGDLIRSPMLWKDRFPECTFFIIVIFWPDLSLKLLLSHFYLSADFLYRRVMSLSDASLGRLYLVTGKLSVATISKKCKSSPELLY